MGSTLHTFRGFTDQRLWRVCDESCVTPMFSQDRSRVVRQLAFSPDGQTLWPRAADGTVVFKRMHVSTTEVSSPEDPQ